MAAPKKSVDLYDKLIATIPGVERKGKSILYTSLNGHMFTYLSATGELGLRLSDKERAAFEKRFKAKPFIQYGAVMKEYVTVPEELFAKTSSVKRYFRLSHQYVQSLTPKSCAGKAVSSRKKTSAKLQKKASPQGKPKKKKVVSKVLNTKKRSSKVTKKRKK
jgi:hypothetical protein